MKKGFTLIELLAVIAIIAILAVITTPIITDVIESSKEATRKDQADSISKTINMKMIDEGITISGVYTKEEALNNLGIKINGDKIIVTLVNDVAYVSLIIDNKAYLSNNMKVYGLKWDGNATYTRLDDAVGMVANVGVDSTVVTNDFDNAQIYSEMKTVIEDGNAFVKIPKFYIKKVVNGDEWKWYASKIREDEEYYLPACFMDETNNKELDYILVGKYDAALEGTKLVSKTNTVPLVSKNINEFRTYARNNNVDGISGYQLIDIHTIDVLQVLFYIEFGTLNSQSLMYGYAVSASDSIVSTGTNTITVSSGRGSNYYVNQLISVGTASSNNSIVGNLKITNVTGDTITYTTTVYTTGNASNIVAGNTLHNVGNINGLLDNVVATSGSLISNTNGRYPMKYRGIENIYGNVYQLIDGLNIDNDANKIYVNKNANTYASDTITGDYIAIGYSKLTTDGYITKMGYDINNPFVQFPLVSGGTATTKYADYYQNNLTGKNIIIYGGCYYNTVQAGINHIFSYNANNSYLSVGSRLVKTPS